MNNSTGDGKIGIVFVGFDKEKNLSRIINNNHIILDTNEKFLDIPFIEGNKKHVVEGRNIKLGEDGHRVIADRKIEKDDEPIK